METKLVFYKALERDLIRFAIFGYKDGRRYLARPVELEFVLYEGTTEATFSMEGDSWKFFTENLKDCMKQHGLLEPSSELNSTKIHLEDMRKIAFKALDIND